MTGVQTCALPILTHLGKEFKDSIFCKNSIMIKNFFKFKPNDVIVMFIYYVYSYDEFRQKIKLGDDEFFMKQTYNDAKNAGYEVRIFEFKDIWIDTVREYVYWFCHPKFNHSFF